MFKKIAKGAGIGLLATIIAGTGYIAAITPRWTQWLLANGKHSCRP
jgi:hypothetical protein